MNLNELAERAALWDVETFGPAVYGSIRERAMRTLEEAIELAQAGGVTRDEIARLVEHVYSKSIGDQQEEIADVMLCLLVYAHRVGMDLDGQMPKLLDRVEKISAHIQRKYAEKFTKGLTAFASWSPK